ncbi:hypothetical protein M9458_043360, partial [Cirrhinus mrigala]
MELAAVSHHPETPLSSGAAIGFCGRLSRTLPSGLLEREHVDNLFLQFMSVGNSICSLLQYITSCLTVEEVQENTCSACFLPLSALPASNHPVDLTDQELGPLINSHPSIYFSSVTSPILSPRFPGSIRFFVSADPVTRTRSREVTRTRKSLLQLNSQRGFLGGNPYSLSEHSQTKLRDLPAHSCTSAFGYSVMLQGDSSRTFHFLSSLRDRMSGPEMVPADLEHLWGVIQQQSGEIMSLRQELVGLQAEVPYRDLAEVFSKRRAALLPPHRPYDLAIDLVPGAVPPRGHLYSLSATEHQAMEEYVAEGLRAGTIRPSSSPAAAGFFFVKKKDGGLRPCVDYRGLNQLTIKNRHPLPLTNTALDALSGARFFTKLDLRSAYNLVRIREGDEWKTAFITPTGHYETLVMPFGLCNSPSVFQQFINDVLRDMLGRWCNAYLDDILVYSKTLEEHTQHVRAVLRRLLAHQLYCKLEKCAFHQHTTTFLGFVISSQGVAMDPQKLEVVRSWPLPTSLKQLQRFLGFANFYQRFIQGFSATAAPLTALTKPSRGEFQLTPEAIQAFKKLCLLFTTAPVLIHPNSTKPFVVEVDASDVGVGAVLSQRGPDEKLHPCSFFSRKFNPTQQRYGVGDRELLAIKWALEEWRHWLQGGSDPFTVWTDHQNLTVIRQTKQLNPRQARWALFFEHFHFHLSYRPGSKNAKADAISHQHQRDTTSSEPAPVLPPHIILAPLQWGHSLEPPPPETPDSLSPPVGARFHIGRTSGGPENHLVYRQGVLEYVQACNICARSKTANSPSTGELQPLRIPKRPWSHISVDFVTGLPDSQGKNTILTTVDRFSKAVHLVALTGLPSAKTTAELILEHVVRLHGFPKDIVSDRGPQFTAKFWQAFCRLVGTTSSLSSGHHPQTNGQTERANQQLERFLRCFAGEHQRSWARYLVWAELSNNLHTSSATNLSPFEVCYGYQPPVFEHQEPEVDVPSAQQLVRRCRRLWNHARTAIQKANQRYTTQHRRRHPPGRLFHVGDRVYLSTRNIHLKTDSKKLTPRFIGPYKITHRLNPVTFRLQLPASLRIHPVFHQSQLKHVFFSPLSPQVTAPPPVRIIDGGPAYTVRRILDSRTRGRGTQYLVDWEGYGPEERSWVPGRFILDPTLIQDYRRRVSSAPGP